MGVSAKGVSAVVLDLYFPPHVWLRHVASVPRGRMSGHSWAFQLRAFQMWPAGETKLSIATSETPLFSRMRAYVSGVNVFQLV